MCEDVKKKSNKNVKRKQEKKKSKVKDLMKNNHVATAKVLILETIKIICALNTRMDLTRFSRNFSARVLTNLKKDY